jgi:hypothetical protein
MNSQRRQVRPQDFKITLDFEYDEAELAEAENPNPNNQQVQVPRRTWRQYIGSILSSIWFGVRYIFTIGGSIANVGNEQQDFDCGQALANDERLLPALGLR